MRAEQCACGAIIIAPANDWRAIQDAVNRHNLTVVHTSWRMGFRLERDRGTWTPDGYGVVTLR